MDKEAVWSASENELHKLGLTERDHIICLKNFCMPSAATTDADIKKELAAAVKQASKHRVVAKKKKLSATSSNIKETTRLEKKTVSLGWMNYDKKKNDFVAVRESTGEEPGQSHFQILQMEMTYFQHVRNCFSPKASQNLGN